MKDMKMIKAMTALAFLWAMVSCSPLKVVVEMKNPTDFSQYATYSFLGWQNESGDILSEEDKGFLREAFTREFERRGLTRVNSGGDMEISLFIVTSQETAVSGYNDYVGRGYGAYSYYGGGYGYGTSNNTYKIRSKLVGTLIMDVYDGKSKNQVWQAIATGVVEKNPQKRSRTIPASIATFMREFPVKVK
jgi:hypothetical protein